MSKNWYILQTYTGYEQKIERELLHKISEKELDSSIVTDIKVPIEETVEVKDGKQRTHKDKFLPGYIMIEMDLPEFDWQRVCATIRRIKGVNGFVGTSSKERPRHISSDEAKILLQKCGAIKGEKSVHTKLSYDIGDKVKIIDGPFATFSGDVDEVNVEKDRLRVTVQIFGRATPVEVNLSQVEKI